MYVYTVNGDTLSAKTTISVGEQITVIAYSPDGKSVAVTSGKSIVVFDAANYQVHRYTVSTLNC